MLVTPAIMTRDLRLAGMPVRIAAEESVARFVLTPFAHLEAAAAEPILAIRVTALDTYFDVPETGTVSMSDDGDTITHTLRDCVAVYRRAAGTIEAQVREEGSASWRRAKPLQLVLSIFFADHGIDLVHAGVASLDGKGVLFAGMGGSGKSTASIAAMLDGFDFLGDDCVGIRNAEAFSIYASACLHPEHARKFDGLVLPSAFSPLPADKQVVWPQRMIPATPIRAIVLPRVTRADRVSIHPTTAADALRALAPSSVLKRAVPAAETFARIAALVREVPSYRMEMGPIAEIGPALRRLLS